MLENMLGSGKPEKRTPLLQNMLGVPAKQARATRELEQKVGLYDRAESLVERAAGAVVHSSPVQAVFDLISRPNFALAALSRGLVRGDIRAGMSDAFREFFSGAGGLEGEKVTFGDVLEESGMGTGGNLSDLMPFLFNDTGRGIQLQRGGFFDITPRGTLGVALDVATDPLTYITGPGAIGKYAVRAGKHVLNPAGIKKLEQLLAPTRKAWGTASEELQKLPAAERKAVEEAIEFREFGGLDALEREQPKLVELAREHMTLRDTVEVAEAEARQQLEKMIDDGATQFADPGGIKFMGHTIVPQSVLKAKISDPLHGVVKYLDETTLGHGVIDIGRGLTRAFGSREFRFRNEPKFLEAEVAYTNRIEFMERTAKDLTESTFRGLTRSEIRQIRDAVETAATDKLPDKLKRSADRYIEVNARMAAIEVEEGLLDHILDNYILHAYEGDPRKIKQILAKKRLSTLKANLRGSEKARTIPGTIAEIEKELAAAGIKPIGDLDQLFYMRLLRHGHGVETKRFFQQVKGIYGELPETVKAAGLSGKMSNISKIREAAKAAEDIPLGLARKPVVDNSLRNLSDDSLQGLREKTIRPLDELEARVDNLTVEEKRRLAKLQDQFDAIENEEFRREMLANAMAGEANDLAIVAGQIRQLNLSTESGKTRALLLLDAVKQAGREKELYDVIAQAARQSPDLAEIMQGKLGDINKLIQELQRGRKKYSKPLAKTKNPPIEEIRKWSEAEQRLFIRERFNNISNPREFERVMNKYREFERFFPDVPELSAKKTPTLYGEQMTEIVDIPDLKGVHLPKAVADEIVDFHARFISSKELNSLVRAYDLIHNKFKASVTSLFPSFHFRNAYSNIVNMFTDTGIQALNPVLHTDAVRLLAGDLSGVFKTKVGAVGYDQLAYEMRRYGVMTDYSKFSEMVGEYTRRGDKNLWNPAVAGRRFGTLIENEARATQYLALRRRGMSASDAAARVKKVLFDYNEITPFERTYAIRALPFYRWTRKNIALQVGRLVKNPGQAAIQAKLTRQQAADPKTLPRFARGELAFELGTDEQGNITTVTGIDFPVSDLNLLWDETAGRTLRNALGMVTPPLQAVIELGTGTRLFDGRKIEETGKLRGLGPLLEYISQKPGGEQLASWMEFSKQVRKDGAVEYYVNPTKAYITTKALLISRLFNTADKFFAAKNEARTAEGVGNLLTGLNLRDVSPTASMKSLVREYQEYLEAKGVASGKLKRFSRTFEPKGGRR